MSDFPREVRPKESRNSVLAITFSLGAALIVCVLLSSFAISAFERSIARSIIEMAVHIVFFVCAIYGVTQLTRHEQPPTLGRKWVDIRFGLAVLASGFGLLLRDLVPSVAAAASKLRTFSSESSPPAAQAAAEVTSPAPETAAPAVDPGPSAERAPEAPSQDTLTSPEQAARLVA